VAEGGGLENHCVRKGTESSNLSLSASAPHESAGLFRCPVGRRLLDGLVKHVGSTDRRPVKGSIFGRKL
jgi:hypothetical protein